jgi:hypothetical protein
MWEQPYVREEREPVAVAEADPTRMFEGGPRVAAPALLVPFGVVYVWNGGGGQPFPIGSGRAGRCQK